MEWCYDIFRCFVFKVQYVHVCSLFSKVIASDLWLINAEGGIEHLHVVTYNSSKLTIKLGLNFINSFVPKIFM